MIRFNDFKQVTKEFKQELSKEKPSYADIGINIVGMIFYVFLVIIPTVIGLLIMAIMLAPLYLLSYVLGFVTHKIRKLTRGNT